MGNQRILYQLFFTLNVCFWHINKLSCGLCWKVTDFFFCSTALSLTHVHLLLFLPSADSLEANSDEVLSNKDHYQFTLMRRWWKGSFRTEEIRKRKIMNFGINFFRSPNIINYKIWSWKVLFSVDPDILASFRNYIKKENEGEGLKRKTHKIIFRKKNCAEKL